MKSTKIIIIFIVLIISMSGGYWIYNHNQKVGLAQYYYNIGDYQKASDLKVDKISSNALSIVNAMGWEDDINKYLKYNDKFYLSSFQGVIENIYNSNLLLEHGSGDKNNVEILNKYYKQIADYLNVPESRLDEIVEMGSDKGIVELTNLL